MTKFEFASATRDLFAALNQPSPTNDILRVWWAKLQDTQLDDLTKSYDLMIDALMQPTLAHVLVSLPMVEVKTETKIEVSKFKKVGDGKDRARKILANPKGYPDISLRYAKTALSSIRMGLEYD